MLHLQKSNSSHPTHNLLFELPVLSAYTNNAEFFECALVNLPAILLLLSSNFYPVSASRVLSNHALIPRVPLTLKKYLLSQSSFPHIHTAARYTTSMPLGHQPSALAPKSVFINKIQHNIKLSSKLSNPKTKKLRLLTSYLQNQTITYGLHCYQTNKNTVHKASQNSILGHSI